MHPAETLAGRMDFTVGCLRRPCLLASPHLILNTGDIKATINNSYKKLWSLTEERGKKNWENEKKLHNVVRFNFETHGIDLSVCPSVPSTHRFLNPYIHLYVLFELHLRIIDNIYHWASKASWQNATRNTDRGVAKEFRASVLLSASEEMRGSLVIIVMKEIIHSCCN